MSRIPGKVKISHLTIPGTRASAQYQQGPYQFQSLAIGDQFNSGVRSFDIPVSFNDGTMIVNFGSSSPTKLTDFFTTCINFLTQQPGETILITLEPALEPGEPSSIWASDIEQAVMAQGPGKFYRWPDHYLASSSAVTDWPALDDVRGKVLLLTTAPDFGTSGPARNVGQWQAGAHLCALGDGLNLNSGNSINPSVQVSASYLSYRADGNYGPTIPLLDNDMPNQKSALFYAFQSTENDVTAASLCLTTTGTRSDLNNPSPKLNAFVEDILENRMSLPSTEAFLGFMRLGVVSMDFITPYESELLYLSNFVPELNTFKPAIAGDLANGYYVDGSLQNPPKYNSTCQPGPIASFSAVPTYPVVDPAAGRYELFDITKIDPSKWMSYLPDAVTLDRINIPGSHDALSWPGLVTSQSQYDNLVQQLADGAREFDFRLSLDASSNPQYLVGYHGTEIFHGLTFHDRLRELSAFLAQHPSETVVLHIGLGNNTDNRGALDGEIWDFNVTHPGVLWKNPDYVYSGWPAHGELRGKIVLVTKEDMTTDPGYGTFWKDLGFVDQVTGNNGFLSGYYTVVHGGSIRSYRKFRTNMQDFWSIAGDNPVPTKWNDILEQFKRSSATNNNPNRTLYLNRTGYEDLTKNIYARNAANDLINPSLVNFLPQWFVNAPATGQPLGRTEFNCEGIVEMDFVNKMLCSLVYLSNLRNADYY